MRFVQFSDCHLGSAGSSSLALPDEKNAILRDDVRDSVKAACRIAKENMAHLVLIPGDVFDFELLKPEITSFLIDLLESLAPTPVFIAPGNHDGLRPGSPYMPASDISWPNNVHIFTTQNFESVAVRELDCTITGVAHVHRGITDRLLSERISRLLICSSFMVLERDSGPVTRNTLFHFPIKNLPTKVSHMQLLGITIRSRPSRIEMDKS